MGLWRKLFGPSKQELEARIQDMERHFVTKRDPSTGKPVETLADVPIKKREKRDPKLSFAQSLKGMTWQQRRKVLEETDGGRRL
jgi:hypothetical protein